MRWVISPIIGNGTADIIPGSEDTTGPYRLRVSKYGGHTAIIPGNEDGTPKFNWGFGRIPEVAASVADADSLITVFPDLPLNHEITLAQRNWLRTRLQNHNLPYLWVNTGDTVLSIVRTVGRYLENTFDFDWLSIKE